MYRLIYGVTIVLFGFVCLPAQAQTILAAPEAIVVESRVPVAVSLGSASIDVSGYTITNNAPALFPVGATEVLWTATEDSGPGMETAVQKVFVLAPREPSGQTFYVDKLHPGASDSNPGTELLPWATIQKAANTLLAGQRVYVKAGTYTELAETGIFSVPAIVLKNSGTPGHPIIFEAFPGDKVVIDQQGQGNAFDTMGMDDIVIRGFEMFRGSIRTQGGSSAYAERILIEENYVHHVETTPGNNIGLIMPYDCMGCVIRNNVMHDSTIAGQPNNANASGIHVYTLQNSLIENNEIYNSTNGIFVKNFQSTNNPERLGSVFRNNLIHDVYRGIWFSIAGAGNAGHRNHTISHNIFTNTTLAVTSNPADAGEASLGQVVRNNLFVGPTIGVATKGYSGLQIYDNIFYKSKRFGTDNSQPPNFLSGIDYSDFNLFFQNTGAFYLNLNGNAANPPAAQSFSSLSAWQGATAVIGGLSFDHPDNNSFEADPLFVDPENADYHLQATSPARGAGRFGHAIGPYVTGNELIGPNINGGNSADSSMCWPVKSAMQFAVVCL